MEIKLNSPLLPLRDIVVFPGMVIPLFVGRDKSITALNEVMKNDKKIVLVSQKNSEVDDPKKNDIFTYGCESSILQLLKLPDGTVKVLIEGNKRVKILNSSLEVAPKELSPGKIYTSSEDHLYVGCLDRKCLRVQRLQIEGKLPVGAKDFIKGNKEKIVQVKKFSSYLEK